MTAKASSILAFLLLLTGLLVPAWGQQTDICTPENHGAQLYSAAASGDVMGIQDALAAGAPVNCTNVDGGWTPLLIAARGPGDSCCGPGWLAAVQMLVQNGADINKRDNIKDKTPLLAASFKGRTDVAVYLIAKGADVNLQSINGFTAIHDAGWIGATDIVKALIQAGANLQLRNGLGEIPLWTTQRAFITNDPFNMGDTIYTTTDYLNSIDAFNKSMQIKLPVTVKVAFTDSGKSAH